MEIRDRVEELRCHCGVIAALVDGVGIEQARWRPAPERWTIVEVINHLADEEHEDFRRRFALTITDPAAEWPPIDPQGAITERGYNDRELRASLDAFLEQRTRSLEWLDSLTDVDLDCQHEHPVFPPLKAGDLLVSWVAHDLHHIRQIVQLKLEHLTAHAGAYSVEYAG
jgi:hypothetical protein